MFDISIAEKIETIVETRRSGALGEFVAVEAGLFRVTVEGKTYIVRAPIGGHWSVSFCGMEHLESRLIDAAADCVAYMREIAGRATVTRNVRLGA